PLLLLLLRRRARAIAGLHAAPGLLSNRRHVGGELLDAVVQVRDVDVPTTVYSHTDRANKLARPASGRTKVGDGYSVVREHPDASVAPLCHVDIAGTVDGGADRVDESCPLSQVDAC